MFDDLFSQVLSSDTGTGANANARRAGVNIAKVFDIKDPDGLGRVRCEFISGNKSIDRTDWVFVVSPFAGNKSGLFFHPNVGDVVLLAFEDGDIHAPFVIGSLWWKNSKNDIEQPVLISGDNEKNNIHMIMTPKGNSITLSDEDKKERIEVKTKAGSEFTIDDGKNKIEIKDKSGNTGITIDTEKGEISIKCTKLDIDVKGNKLTIDSGGIKIDCKPSISVKSASTTIEATGTNTVKGAVLNLESSGIANLKGSLVKIN